MSDPSAALNSSPQADCRITLQFLALAPAHEQTFEAQGQSFAPHHYEQLAVVTGEAGIGKTRLAEAVVDAARLEQFALWGISGAPAVAIAYAVRHPERVSRLVLYGGYAQGTAVRARTEDRAHGETVVRELWTHALAPGEVDFPGARLLLGVCQTHLRDDGTKSVEWRYFVTSLSTVDLSFKHLLKLVRLHWAGVPFAHLPTRVTYPPGGISHFRLWRDNVLISAMHTALFFGMLPRIPLLLARKWKRK